ncbi:MAG: ABC transporter ATP-binding protein [Bdellovibrionia bacterium]
MSKLFEIEKLNYSYRWNHQEIPVLKNLDLVLEASTFNCIVGPSGTGKTTLLNIMGLLDTARSGNLKFNGTDISSLSESQKEEIRLNDLGFVFQSYFLLPTLTVLENTVYFLKIMRQSPEQADKRATEILEILGLKDHLKKYPQQLSGGQRQRVAIARALAKKPKVILADEPTANLDEKTAELTIKAFQDLQEKEKTTFIFSTHDMHLVSYAQQVFKMNNGQLERTR